MRFPSIIALLVTAASVQASLTAIRSQPDLKARDLQNRPQGSCWTQIDPDICFDLNVNSAGEKVGEVCLDIFNEDKTTFLLVNFDLNADYYLNNVQAWAGPEIKDVPTNVLGKPKAREFPSNSYLGRKEGKPTKYTLALDLEGHCITKLDLMARASVVPARGGRRSTAWTAGPQFGSHEKISYSPIGTIACACPSTIAISPPELPTLSITPIVADVDNPLVEPDQPRSTSTLPAASSVPAILPEAMEGPNVYPGVPQTFTETLDSTIDGTTTTLATETRPLIESDGPSTSTTPALPLVDDVRPAVLPERDQIEGPAVLPTTPEALTTEADVSEPERDQIEGPAVFPAAPEASTTAADVSEPEREQIEGPAIFPAFPAAPEVSTTAAAVSEPEGEQIEGPAVFPAALEASTTAADVSEPEREQIEGPAIFPAFPAAAEASTTAAVVSEPERDQIEGPAIFPAAPEASTTAADVSEPEREQIEGPEIFPAFPAATEASTTAAVVSEPEIEGPAIFPEAPAVQVRTAAPPPAREAVSTTTQPALRGRPSTTSSAIPVQFRPDVTADTGSEAVTTTESPIVLADDGRCRRAFALCESNTKEVMCFGDISRKYQRLGHWGWTQVVTGFDLQCDLWVGAVDCDTSKGSKIGSATITKSSFEVDINDGFEATNVHFYHGENQLPKDHRDKSSVAPDYYGVPYPIADGPKWAIDGTGVPAFDDYENVPHSIILHATVCKI